MTPKKLFRIVAVAEMVTWTGLIVGMIFKYAFGNDRVVPITGGIHGFVFLCYGVTTVFVWVNQKWKPGVGLVGLFSTIVPYATVPFELWAQKRGLLEGPWRLAPGGEAPKNFPEHVEAWVLRRPLIAIVLVVIAVIAVFTTLLWLGPPGGPRG
mgnify:FL=1